MDLVILSLYEGKVCLHHQLYYFKCKFTQMLIESPLQCFGKTNSSTLILYSRISEPLCQFAGLLWTLSICISFLKGNYWHRKWQTDSELLLVISFAQLLSYTVFVKPLPMALHRSRFEEVFHNDLLSVS